MSKHLLFIIDSLVGGGAERIMTYIVNKLDKERFSVSLCLSLGSKIDYDISKEIKLYHLLEIAPPNINTPALIHHIARICDQIPFSKSLKNSYWKIRSFLEAFYLASLTLRDVIEEEKPDLIVSFLPNSNIIALITKYLFKIEIPIYCSDRNTLSKEIKSLQYPFLYKALQKWLYKKADLHIAISNGVKEDLISKFKVPKEKVITIYNGIDIESVKTQSREPLEEETKEIFSDNETFRIISVGRLAKQKGHEYLLRAFKKVRSKANCHLFILGEGDMRQRLEILAHELGIHRYLYLIGWHKNPFKFMARCNLFVLSSIWEGFGNVIVEAMALGLPIISTDCPSGPSEILDNGKYGILVPPKDEDALANAIIQVFSNKDLRIKLSQMSTERASDFKLERMLDNYEFIFTRDL